MDTMRQIRGREQRLREAMRLGLCTGADPVGTCLDRLATHDRLAALAPELLAFVRAAAVELTDLRPTLPAGGGYAADRRVRIGDMAAEARALLARAAGETEARDG